MGDETKSELEGGERRFYEGVRPLPALSDDDARALADVVRRIACGDIAAVGDRVFERIEKNVERVLDSIAPRLLPKNIGDRVEALVTIRTAAIEGALSGLLTRVGRVEHAIAAGRLGDDPARALRAAGHRQRRRKRRASAKRKARR